MKNGLSAEEKVGKHIEMTKNCLEGLKGEVVGEAFVGTKDIVLTTKSGIWLTLDELLESVGLEKEYEVNVVAKLDLAEIAFSPIK